MGDHVDILYISYNRPHYVRKSLPVLLETCRDNDRVWIWHNGEDKETLEASLVYADHPRVAVFHHSKENKMLRVPTNWFWSKSNANYLAKVDDDCLMPAGWIERLTEAHDAVRSLGVISSWPFLECDFRPEIGGRKIRSFGKYKVMVNPWTGGSGYIMKRSVIDRCGTIRDEEHFTGYCIRAGIKGFVNGWLFPFIYMDHMDDPRSPNTGLRTASDFERFPGLTARRFGRASLEEMRERAVIAALEVQMASPNARNFVGIRAKVRRMILRLRGDYRRAYFDA